MIRAKTGLAAMNLVTIIVSSFNRKILLSRAIESCRNQTNQEFNLILFDDCSTDGAREVLRSLEGDPSISKLILNETNQGFSTSINAALHAVETEWATILCDDDFLDPDFLAASLPALRRTENDCVITSFNQVDADGKVLKAYPQQPLSLTAAEAIAANIPNAGISGFFFRIGPRTDRNLMRDYPRAFFSDTMLIMEFTLSAGLETVGGSYYNKTVWDQAESALDERSARQFFEAMLRFQQDLGTVFDRQGVQPEIAAKARRPTSLLHFGRVLLLPILARGAITRQDINQWYNIAWRYDRRYLPHCTMFALTAILANRHTLGLRSQLHRFYRSRLVRRPIS